MRSDCISWGRSIRTVIAAAAVFALATTACGGDPSDPAPESPTPAAQPDLSRFLILPNEEPGWVPTGKPETIRGVRAFAKDLGGSAEDERRLRAAGFQVFLVRHLKDETGWPGVSNVHLFATPEGANRWMRHFAGFVEQQFEAINRFAVPGVPGARGVTASTGGGGTVTQVLWVQGRCMLVLGNEFERPLVEPARTGVKAIYERTGGRCP